MAPQGFPSSGLCRDRKQPRETLVAIAFISAFIGIFKGGRAWLIWFAVSIALVAVGAPISQAIVPKEVVVARDLDASAVVAIAQAGYEVKPCEDQPGMYEISLR